MNGERLAMMWKLECSIWREDDWYVSECKDLEIASQGRTMKEAQDNLQEAIQLFLEAASFTEVMSYLSRLDSDTPPEIQRNLEVQFTPIDQGAHTTLGEVTLAYAWIKAAVIAQDSQNPQRTWF